MTSTSSPTFPLFGVNATGAADVSAKEAKYGTPNVFRVYCPGLPAANAWEADGECGLIDRPIIVSFREPPASYLNGSLDAAMEAFFGSAPNHFDVRHPIYWSYQSEPEKLIDNGTFTVAEFIAAFRYIAAIAHGARNNFLHPTLILTGYTAQGGAGRNWETYFPGECIQTLGWDTYPPNGEGTPAPASFMEAAVTNSQRAGLPFGFPEFGTVTEAGRPAWLSEVAAYGKAAGAQFVSLYDSTNAGGLGGGGTFEVSDAPSEAAWRAVLASNV
jgi:hypothetical protein